MKNTLTRTPSPSGPAAQGPSHPGTAEAKRAETIKPQQRTDYWKRQLAAVPALNLPTDNPRPAHPASRFASRSVCVPEDLKDSVRHFCTEEKTPLSAVVLSAFGVLLHRYTSQDTILIGCSLASTEPWANNDSRHLPHDLIVRTHLSGDPAFRSLLEDISTQVIEAAAHDDISLLQLVQQHTNSGADGAIFRTAFSYCSPGSVGQEPNLVQPLMAELSLDWQLNIQERGEDIYLQLFYDAELFATESIDRTLRNLQTLLRGAVENPDQRLSKLPILNADEQRQILIEWNQTDSGYPVDKCLHQLVEAQAERLPDQLAVICGSVQLTYAEFNSRANQLAHYLRSRGVGANIRVGICLEPGVDFAVAILAVLKAGGACVPLDPHYPAERLAYMLDDVQARVLITAQGLLPETVPTGCEAFFLVDKGDVLGRQPRTNPNSGVNPGDIAYVIYTSGSTGKPRGVLLPHAGLVNYNAAASRIYAAGPEDRILQFCSISFDIAVEETFASWLSGATVVLRSDMPLAIPEFLEWIAEQRVTILDLPTAYWHEWVHHFPELKNPVPRNVRLVVVGGEKASSTAYAMWRASVGHRVRWINSYGPTEASISVTWYEPKFASSDSIPGNLPIGRPWPNCRIYLLDRYLNPVPVGIPGELHAGGVCVAQGYLNRPELTAEKFIPDPFSSEPAARLYKTGDLARYLPSGAIEYLGRADDQVKIRGFRVELGEIESALAKHPAVADVAVIARQDPSGEKRLLAYLTSAQNAKPAKLELRRYLQQTLPDYMVPSEFVVLDTMPLTPNGKIDRRGLPEPEGNVLSGETAVATDAFQAQLVKVWEEILGKKPIGIRDSFFDLGGHSLLAARLMHRLGQMTGNTVPLAMLLQAPTIEQLAPLLKQDGWSHHWSSVVPMQPAGSHPPFFCVHGVGGNVLNFRELARLMGPDYPFYGMQAQGLDGKRPCFTSIEEIAGHYIGEMKTVQPRGPYFIGGYSLGGVVAYEMAQQLRDSGEHVGLLALLDTYAGNLSSISRTILRLLLRPSRQTIFSDLPIIVGETIQRRFRSLTTSRVLKHVQRTNQAAGDRYVLRPYGGKITLFRATEASLRSFEDLYSTWTRLAGGGLEVQKISGNHKGILVEPQVDQLAAKLKACIDEGAASGRAVSPESRLPALRGPLNSSKLQPTL
jgi:amino acid adenylation domain-containing protein